MSLDLTTPTTFDYAQDWLLSSETLVRTLLESEDEDIDTAREEARARIHREEAVDEPDEEQEGDVPAADPTPAIDPRPRIIIRETETNRQRIGTGTWKASGTLTIEFEAKVPAEYRPHADDETQAARTERFHARKLWATALERTIYAELRATSGLGHQDGTPYLNAEDIQLSIPPLDPVRELGDDWMGWEWEVEWQ